LFVCLVVAFLFVADLIEIGFARPIAVLFVLAMLLLIVGLVLFLHEIRLATRALHVRRELLPRPGDVSGRGGTGSPGRRER
jgi:hypothetical protein